MNNIEEHIDKKPSKLKVFIWATVFWLGIGMIVYLVSPKSASEFSKQDFENQKTIYQNRIDSIQSKIYERNFDDQLRKDSISDLLYKLSKSRTVLRQLEKQLQNEKDKLHRANDSINVEYFNKYIKTYSTDK